MQQQIYRPVRYRVMVGLTCGLISLLCTIHYLAPSLLTLTLSSHPTYVAALSSVQEQEPTSPPAIPVTLAAVSGLLYLLANYLVTLTLKLPLWQPSLMADLKPRLALAFLVLATLALLVVTLVIRI